MAKGPENKTYKIRSRGSDSVIFEHPSHNLIRANLNGLNLHNADLSNVDLSGADLRGTNLFQANLVGATLDAANLSSTDFDEANLTGAALNHANLFRASLHRAILCDASLYGAELTKATLKEAQLDRADLGRANLNEADLRRASLDGASLKEANLIGADLSEATLIGAYFEHTVLQDTVFSSCPTLADTKGIKQIWHRGPSTLDHQTLRACINRLPDKFLFGVGYTRHEIDYLRSLYTKPFYLSCFLSHGHTDSEFADMIYKDLRDKDVSCWHYNYDLKMGKRIDPQIREEIQLRDKLLVVCSKESLTRFAVVKEILEAIKLEDKTNEAKLFPIRLDAHILTQEFRVFHDEMVEKGEWERPWMGRVMSYWIGDFSDWKNPTSYGKKLNELIHQLKKPESRPSE